MELAETFAYRQDNTEARESYQLAVEILDDLVRRDPVVPSYRYDLAVSLQGLAVLQDETDKAVNFLQKANDHFTLLVERFPKQASYIQQQQVTQTLLSGLADSGE